MEDHATIVYLSLAEYCASAFVYSAYQIQTKHDRACLPPGQHFVVANGLLQCVTSLREMEGEDAR